MIVGHYATALLAHQHQSKSTLLFFLIVSQFQEFLWFILYYLGLEHTTPSDAFDATIKDMVVNMLYSHDLLPQAIWMLIIFGIGRLLYRKNSIALAGALLILGHFILDFFSGHPHHVFGEQSHAFGLGLYHTHPYLAILIEAIFSVVAMAYIFSREAKQGIRRTAQNKSTIIAVFVYGLLFLFSTATVSLRETFHIPQFDLGINTLIPTLIMTYVAMLVILYRAIPRIKI